MSHLAIAVLLYLGVISNPSECTKELVSFHQKQIGKICGEAKHNKHLQKQLGLEIRFIVFDELSEN